MSKQSKSAGADRRRKLEQVRQEQQQRERRRTMLVVGAAAVVAIALIGGAILAVVNQASNDPANREWAALGVPAAQASCDPVEEEPTSGNNDHRSDGERIDYGAGPPSSGAHYNLPASLNRKFYAPGEGPQVEELVHNLEHGYTVLWYDPAVSDDAQQTLRDLAKKVTEDERLTDAVNGKFIAAPWDTERGDLAEGKDFVLTHWGTEQGYRQACGSLSGEVVRDFVTAHPYTDSPEPGGA